MILRRVFTLCENLVSSSVRPERKSERSPQDAGEDAVEGSIFVSKSSGEYISFDCGLDQARPSAQDERKRGVSGCGFSLIEIIVALAIVGIISALILPTLQYMQPGRERRDFISRVSAVAQSALEQAIVTRSVHRVVFDAKERRVHIEREETRDGNPRFIHVKGVAGAAFSWPRSIQIKQFIVEEFDEMQRFAGRKTETMWFFVVPDGLTQRVTINALDTESVDEAGKPWQIGLVLNPFTAQFKVYNEFQK